MTTTRATDRLGPSVLALDVGGTHLRTGMISQGLSVSGFERVSSQEVLNGVDPLSRLAEHIEGYLQRRGPNREIEAVAIGFPATVDVSRRVVLSSANIPAMRNLPVVDVLERRLGLPVLIDRDANMHLRHDLRAHELHGPGVVIGCYVGTGLGNAISIDGQVFAGHHGVAGELGHVVLADRGALCGCGGRGCLETMASGRALTRLTRGRFPATPIADVFRRHGDDPEIRAYVRMLAVPIAMEITILDPGAVVLGGGVVQADSFPRELLEASVRDRVRRPRSVGEIDFRYSPHGQETALIGAAIHAWSVVAGAPRPAGSREVCRARRSG